MSAEEEPTPKYKDFIAQCITNETPLGYENLDLGFDKDSASGCIINDTNANHYLNYLDTRVELGLSQEDDQDATPESSAAATDKRALAEKIIAKNKISYNGDVKPMLDKIADGSVDANAEPCGININILKIIDKITDSHAITISDINRHCTNTTYASGTSSRHYAGNGSAIDIAVIDGKATTGRDDNAVSIINLVMPLLSEAGAISNSESGIGQKQCGDTPTLAAHVKTFDDGCTHLHLDVAAQSDTTLKFDPAGF